jgi:protein-S-isoprenylcysteine O-methyltransferase Ste14
MASASPANSAASAAATPAWARACSRLATWLSQDFLGGPRPWKLAWIVNFQKGGTFLFLGALMLFYGNGTPAAWLYLALHGTYGLAWLMKDLAFPDPGFQVRVTIGGGINAFLLVLGPYWSFGWLLISGTSRPAYPLADPAWFALCTSLCLLGCGLMLAADAQKYFTLRLRPGLITDGLHRWVRHPNYLGEMMVYGSFALLAWHWFPPLVLAFVWGFVFAPNMIRKEASLARHPGWAEYRRRTWWVLPPLL